jgi:predicted component of type VI protein secretion system
VDLRPEGLVVLAPSESEASRLADRVLSEEGGEASRPPASPHPAPTALAPQPLSLDDAFVLLDEVPAP